MRARRADHTCSPEAGGITIHQLGKQRIFKGVPQASQLAFTIVTESLIRTRSETCFTSHPRVIWSKVLQDGRVEIPLEHIYCRNDILHHRLDELANCEGNN